MTRTLALTATAFGLVVVLMLSLAWGLQHAALNNPSIMGSRAPAIAVLSIDSVRVDLPAAGRPAVLNFWASWCTECVAESEVLDRAAAAHRDVQFVGADVQDTADGYRQFEATHPHTYPSGPLVAGRAQDYGVAGIPVTYFINAGGLLVASFSGPLDQSTLDHYLALVAA